jgi:hypothetical protein
MRNFYRLLAIAFVLLILGTTCAFAANPLTNLLIRAVAEFKTEWIPAACFLVGGFALLAWGFGSHKGQSMVVIAIAVICCLIGLTSFITWASS